MLTGVISITQKVIKNAFPRYSISMNKLIPTIALLMFSLSSFAGGFFTMKDGVISMVPKERTHKIKDFSTDGCSSFPDGYFPTQSTEWLECCIIHDVDYWIGGEEYLKVKADDELGYCVSNNAHPLLGISMDIGVTIGGAPSLMPWRWGYGWDAILGYVPIDDEQLRSAAAKYDTVIDAILNEKELLNPMQRLKVQRKLQTKLVELYEYLGNNKNSREAEYERLLKRTYKLML